MMVVRWFVRVIPITLLAMGAAAVAEEKAATSQGAPATATARAPDYYALGSDAFFKLPAVQERFTKDHIDIALLNAAIFHQTNIVRTREGLPALAHSPALETAAQRHAEEMAHLGYFSHQSPVAENRTMKDRLAAVGVAGGMAENILVRGTLNIPSGRVVIITDASGKEDRLDAETRKPVGLYRYDDFARVAVEEWMNSPGHRANILDKRQQFLGAGAARGTYGSGKQDSLFLTQNFSAAPAKTKP